MKMSFARDFLNTQEIELFDKRYKNRLLGSENTIEIEIQKPYIIQGLDLLKAVYGGKVTLNKKLLSYEELKGYGLDIVKRPIGYWKKFYPQQKYYYVLHRKGTPTRFGTDTIVVEQPKSIVIRMKIRERQVRLEGIDSGEYGVGMWVPNDIERKILMKRKKKDET